MKKILIGLSVSLGVVTVATAVTLTTIHFIKKNKTTQTPSTPSIPEEEKDQQKQNFINALANSTFTKPSVFTLEVTKSENEEQTIIDALKTKWSGKANPIKVNQVGSEYVVSVNANTNTYTNNIYGKVWTNILEEENNIDFKNIKQVNYGFRITKVNETQYQLVPTYTQVAFVTKPTWVDENEESVRVSLLKNKDLISTINIK